MSYSTVYAIRPNESATEVAELRNGWGSAPVIWDALCQKYLARDSWRGDDKALWALARDARLPECERAVHAMTFDRAYVKAQNIPRAIAHIEEFLKLHPISLQRVNHWPEIAQIMRDSLDGAGFALTVTSVSSDLWVGDWNEEKEDYDPLDWSKTWEIYDVLDQAGIQKATADG